MLQVITLCWVWTNGHRFNEVVASETRAVSALSLAAHLPPAACVRREWQCPLPVRVVWQHLDAAEDAENRQARRLRADGGMVSMQGECGV
jgi:hypothetical protein